MRRKRVMIAAVFSAVCLLGTQGLAAGAASSAAPVNDQMQVRINLAWFMAGLRDLAKSKDKNLRLLPAQAKKLLPDLEKLVKDKVIMTEIPQLRQNPRNSGGNGNGQSGQAWQGQDRNLSAADRRKRQEEMRKQVEAIQAAIDRMEKCLSKKQDGYVLGLDFDAKYYGLGGFERPAQAMAGQGGAGQSRGTFDRSQLQKQMQERQDGMKRLVALNNEVLKLIRQLAK